MAIIKREISGEKAYRDVYEVVKEIKRVVEIPDKEVIDIEDFAPNWLKKGAKIVDPITKLRGEVIGYEERSILIPISRE